MLSNVEWRVGRLYLLLLPVIVAIAVVAKAYLPSLKGCPAFSDEDSHRVATYLGQRFGLGEPNGIEVYSGATLSGTCTRKISVHAAHWKQDQVFFLSPDKHYLYRQVADLTHPPKEAGPVGKATVEPPAQELSGSDMAALASGDLPSIGPRNAPVQIVEFSDFQCPFCKRLAETLEEKVLPAEKDNVRVVFRQFPLPIHSHAREEAELAACAAHQNNAAFWALYDYLFDHQELAKSGNIVPESLEFLRKQTGVDSSTLRTCLNSHAMAHQVDTDVQLGERYGVAGTPTLFINGARMVGARDDSSIEKLIEQRTPNKASLSGRTLVGSLETKAVN